jgi:hypothetical protein
MFLNLLMFNVRKAGDVRYDFSHLNRILLRGENGAGKSTVREGLIFALTGRDSSGGQCPIHLIARGENSLRVVLKTKSWTIKRTLTLKKNSSLTLEKDNVPEFKVNNAELLEFLGVSLEGLGAPLPPDIYMSAVIPGFFMSQTSARRFSMLSMVLPQFDRAAYVASLSGYSEQDVLYMCNNFSKGIPNYQNYVPYRLEQQRLKATMEGRADEIVRNITQEVLEPEKPAAIMLLPIAEKYLQDINEYTTLYQNHHTLKGQRDYAVMENSLRMRRKEDLEKKISELSVYEPLVDIDESRHKALQKELLPLPKNPSTVHLPTADRCPTCAQIVGSSLREQVAAENERAKKDYEGRLQSVAAHNDKIYNAIREEQTIIKKATDHNNEVRENNRTNFALQEALTEQLNQAVLLPVPEIAPPPTRPMQPAILIQHNIGPYKKDIATLRGTIDNYNKNLGAYEKTLRDREKGKDELVTLSKDLEEMGPKILQREKFEHALRTLAQEEVMAQRESLQLKNYRIDFTEGFDVIHESGTPYECLSSGETLALDIALCMKFHKFLSNKIGWCFVDDADLFHDLTEVDKEIPEDVQVFYAAATSGYKEVVITGIRHKEVGNE